MADNMEKKVRVHNRTNETGIYRNHKDGVAYKLFSGKKESLSLYNSIMKTDYTDPDELEIVTLNSAIYIGRKNDNAIILHFNPHFWATCREEPLGKFAKVIFLVGYIKYVNKTRKYHKEGMTYEEAVKKSVDECIKENILKEFFIKNKAEVISMTIFEYDEEEHMRLEREEQYRKGEEQGIEIGEKKGENKKMKELITKKLAKGKEVSQIADELEEDEETILKLIEKINEE